MNVRSFLILVLVIISNTIFSQQSLNNYKYVIVPVKFDFLKSEDQYQLNSLAKFLFKKEGFEVLYNNEIKPKILANSPCLGLIADVKNSSGMFTTKLVIELTNCHNQIIFTSIEGASKEKDYKKGYHAALRKAFQSITSLDYKYNPENTPVVKEKEVVVIEEKPVAVEKEVVSAILETTIEEEKPVEEVEKVIPAEIEVIKPKHTEVKDKRQASSNLLYAQANTLGYQLVDSTPKVVYILLRSSKEGVYFLRNKKGIIFKENDQWIAEYYELDKLVQKTLSIKF